ncbi:MAG: carbohydrate ABC transporter permease [Saccharofermentanales bacterium]
MKKRTMKQKQNIVGLLFVLPFITGMIAVFGVALGQSLLYSVQKFIVAQGIPQPQFTGIDNYRIALFVEPQFVRIVVSTVGDMLLNLPIILIFSFFAANLLNQKFKGRALARAIFFFPVVATIGVIASLGSNDLLMGIMGPGSGTASSVAGQVRSLLYSTSISPVILNYIFSAVDRIYLIVNMSGVQILIALSGLQSIPHSLYESADIDGATGWEKFWKITFPMMSPMLILNAVYTVIDLLTRTDNELMNLIRGTVFQSGQTGLGSAMSWIYFAVISLMLAILILPASRKVFYNE